MATTVYSYFGDYLLGLFVTWESTSGSLGSTDVTITLTANLRSKLHVYGLGSNTENELATFSMNGSAVTITEQDYDPTNKNEYTTNNNAFIGYIGTGTTNTDLAVVPANKYPADGDQSEVYHFYLAWQNPDATGAVTYDGMEVKAFA